MLGNEKIEEETVRTLASSLMLLVFAWRFSCLFVGQFVGFLVWTLWHFRCISFVLVCQRKRKFLMLPIGRRFAWIALKRLPSLFSLKIKCFPLARYLNECFKVPKPWAANQQKRISMLYFCAKVLYKRLPAFLLFPHMVKGLSAEQEPQSKINILKQKGDTSRKYDI